MYKRYGIEMVHGIVLNAKNFENADTYVKMPKIRSEIKFDDEQLEKIIEAFSFSFHNI